ncbi:MAG: hypothetical protein MZU97_10780 [Bacillus subtilis]|nr:hypothetical protein [Bacillus subtilis]
MSVGKTDEAIKELATAIKFNAIIKEIILIDKKFEHLSENEEFKKLFD